MTKREIVRVSENIDECPPENVLKFMEWLKARLESVPAEHRASAEYCVDIYMDHGDSFLDRTFNYQRLETDEEMAEREASIRADKERYSRKERATYEALKKKYG